jgi:hypothetical protein
VCFLQGREVVLRLSFSSSRRPEECLAFVKGPAGFVALPAQCCGLRSSLTHRLYLILERGSALTCLGGGGSCLLYLILEGSAAAARCGRVVLGRLERLSRRRAVLL